MIAELPEPPLLSASRLTRLYGPRIGCADVDLEIYEGRGASGGTITPLTRSIVIEAT